MRSAIRFLPLALVAVLSSCTDGVTDSPTSAPSGALSTVSAAALNAGGGAHVAPTGATPVAGTRIPDRYIVIFRPGSAAGRTLAEAMVREANGTLHFTYETVIEGFAATLPESAIPGIERNPNVLYIEADAVVTTVSTLTQTNATWGLDRIDQRDLPLSGSFTYGATGTGVRGFIVDTGIRSDHVEFSGRLLAGYTAIADGRGTEDCNGHGTHVASTTGGTVYGVAKEVLLVPVRVLECTGSGTTSGVIAGMDWIGTQRSQDPSVPMVANLSLGGSASTSMDSAVDRLSALGVPVVVAAGNSNLDACQFSPARAVSAITVGATLSTDFRATYSNFGSCVDLFAPGSAITAAWPTSPTDLRTISGTSMASPHVAGAVALYLEQVRSPSAASVKSFLTTTATVGTVSSAGSGSPNLLLFVDPFHTVSPEPDPGTGGPQPEPEPEPEPGTLRIASFEVTNTSNRTFARAAIQW